MTAYTQTPADVAGAADGWSKSPALVIAGAIGGADAVGLARAPGGLADAAGAVDTAQPVKGLNAFDVAGGADARTLVQTMHPTQLDAAGAADNVLPVLTRAGLANYQFAINREPWVPFGVGQTINVQTFDMGTTGQRTQDQDSEVADVTLMGLDHKTPPVWAWNCNTDVTDPATALAWVEDLAEAWDAPDIRATPNAAVELLYRIADRDRVVYGRPRNFTPQPGRVQQGNALITLDFKLAEDTMYDADWQSITAFTQTPAAPSTFPPAPWTPPISSSPRTAGTIQQAIIGGRKATWLLAVFTGPLINPVLHLGPYAWGLRGSIAEQRSVSMCGMPWDLGVLDDEGYPLPGMLDPRSRLSLFRLEPGQYAMWLENDNSVVTGRVDLYWRNAYRAH